MHFHQGGTWPPQKQPHVWVFGSNLKGIHGAGTALIAATHFDAEPGVGIGRTGNAYAIPTKNAPSGKARRLHEIQDEVDKFLAYARRQRRNNEFFWVTRIGCGIVGYVDDQIAPMFKGAPENCSFTSIWKAFLV